MPDREKLIEAAAVEIADYLPGDDEWQVEARACAERVVAVLLAALSEEHLSDERVERAADTIHDLLRSGAYDGLHALARAALEAAGPVVVEGENMSGRWLNDAKRAERAMAGVLTKEMRR